MFDVIFQNLFKKKTIAKLEQTTRKFVAGITILMSVFYGTLYYALITLASEDDKVPKPLVSQVGEPAGNPRNFYLESIENRADKIDSLKSESYESYKKFIINSDIIIEPTPVIIKNKLYVPFRLLIASGSNDYEVELKSKKGTQKISIAENKFEYSIFEKQKKGFLKLATIKPEFQVKRYEPAATVTPSPTASIASPSFDTPTPQPSPEFSVEPSLTPEPVPTETLISAPAQAPENIEPTPEPTASPQSFWRGLINEVQADEILSTPDWQDISFANPASTNWTIYDNYIEIKQADGFTLDNENYDVWLKIKIGFDGAEYINSWDFGIHNQDGIESNLQFRVKFRADLAGKINRKANESGNLKIDIEKREDDLATEVMDLDLETDGDFDETNPEETVIPQPTRIEAPQISPTESAAPVPIPVAPVEIETSPIPTAEPTQLPTTIPESLPSIEPTTTPYFDITPTPVETALPKPILEPTPASTPEPIQVELSPTSLLNELLGINTANAEELVEQPVSEPLPINSEESGNLMVEPLSNDSGVSEETSSEAEQIPEPTPYPIIEATSEIIYQITEGLTGFVESASVSLPSLEPEVESGAVPITIFEEPITASVDLSESPQEYQPLIAQIANALNVLNIFTGTTTITSELNFSLGGEGGVNLQIDEASNTITTEISLKSELPTDLVVQPLSEPLNDGGTASPTTTTEPVIRTVLVTISDIGVTVNGTGIWVASGDGSKSTDFKIHFNPNYGGAVDQLYLGTDFATNKIAKPQTGSGGLTLIEQDAFSQAETRSIALEVIEQSKVRIVIKNTFTLGDKVGVEERYAIYATGRIIKSIIYNKKEVGEERWYLNAAKTGFDLPAGYDYNQLILNTKVEPNSKDLLLVWQDPSSLASSSFETGETDNSYIAVAKLNRNPWTYTEHQMIDLMQEDLSMVDKTMIDERAADYRNPDTPEFTLGSFLQFNKHYGSYEMESAVNQNRVIFKMDGSQTPRFQPIFEIHGWENPDLSGIKAFLNQRDLVENRDYIVDFRNSDPQNGILVFHFLSILRVNSEFSADGFGVFDIDPEIAPGSGILIYGDGAEVSTSVITADSTGNLFGAFASVTNGSINPAWVVDRASPVGGSQASGSDNEHIVVSLDNSGVLQALRWDGTAWSVEWTENNVGSQSQDNRAYDIAYENSGEAVAAWSRTNDTTGLLEYRVWNGTSWGASTSFTLPTTQQVTWVEMASHPASGSNQNEIGMCYVTGGYPYAGLASGSSVGCAIWDGSTNTWGNGVLRETDGEENGTANGNAKTVATFYEQSSGDFIEIAGVEHLAQSGGVVLTYSSWNGSSWTATSSFSSGSGTGDSASYLNCSPAPFSLNSTTTKNKAICAGFEGTVGATNVRTIWAFIWDGSAPANENANLHQNINQIPARFPNTTGWLIDGTNNFGMIFWSDLATTPLRYDYWNDGSSAWTTTSSLTHTTGTRNTGFVFAQNPAQKNTGILLVNDLNLDLFAYEASLSGTTVTMACMLNGGVCGSAGENTITKDLTSIPRTQGLAFSLFPNPTQTHYQWLNDDAGLNSGTAAASQDTALTGLAQSTIKRLRVQISNEGVATKSSNFQLEFAKKGSGCTEPTLSAGWRYREIHTVAVTASDAFDIELTANFANGDATTASLSAGDPTFVAGQGIESASSTSAIAINGNNYTEIEYSLQANTNAQASTDYCFRLTDGGASTSFTYTNYGQAQTGAGAVTPPTYTQDYFRFYVNLNDITPTDPWPSSGGADLAENATMSAHFASVASGSITRVRTNVLVSTATLNAASQTFQFQYAEGFKCGAIAGGSWAAVGASTSDTIWRFGSNAGVTDGTALPDSGTLLSNSTNAARATYEEGNPSAVNPNAVSAGQRMEHDWSLQNNGAVSGASYCFRIIRPSGTTFETYNYFPLIVLGPSTDQVLRHGAFFSEGYEQGYYWSGI